MLVDLKIRLYAPCPCCTTGYWEIGHIRIGQDVTWTCNSCHNEVKLERASEGACKAEPTGRKETPVTVTLRSVTEPPITLKLNTWKYAHSQGDSQEEYTSNQQYFYDQHTCPTNWVNEIVEMEFKGDRDPHGVFEFVSAEDGHYVEPLF